MPGRENGPDLGHTIRVGTSSESGSTPSSDKIDTRSPSTARPDSGHRRLDEPSGDADGDDVTRQVVPGTLPAAGEEDGHDSVDVGEFDDRQNKDRDRDHDAEGDVAESGSGDED